MLLEEPSFVSGDSLVKRMWDTSTLSCQDGLSLSRAFSNLDKGKGNRANRRVIESSTPY